MIIKKANIDTVCGITSVIPVHKEIEYVFAGRSNVGKSSLINLLTGQRGLARTSSMPGKTQTINYYKINDDIFFVDLPGYGYTKASLESRKMWGQMVERYFDTSVSIKKIFLLVDIRHDPTSDDKDMLEWIRHRGLDVVIIATKLDKIKKNDLQKNISNIRRVLSCDENMPIIPCSSHTKQGIKEIFTVLSQTS